MSANFDEPTIWKTKTQDTKVENISSDDVLKEATYGTQTQVGLGIQSGRDVHIGQCYISTPPSEYPGITQEDSLSLMNIVRSYRWFVLLFGLLLLGTVLSQTPTFKIVYNRIMMHSNNRVSQSLKQPTIQHEALALRKKNEEAELKRQQQLAEALHKKKEETQRKAELQRQQQLVEALRKKKEETQRKAELQRQQQLAEALHKKKEETQRKAELKRKQKKDDEPTNSVGLSEKVASICHSMIGCIKSCQQGNGEACCRTSSFVLQELRLDLYARNRCIFATSYYRRAILNGYSTCEKPCQQ